nr:hypothetical protein [uncultured bacterium]
MSQLEMLLLHPAVAAQMVDGAILGNRHEPGARLFRDARLRPPLQGSEQRVLRQVFSDPYVPDDPRQPGDDPGGFDSPYRVDRPVGRGHYRLATSGLNAAAS